MLLDARESKLYTTAGLFPPHSALSVGDCSSWYPMLRACSLFPSLNPAHTAGLSMVLSV